MIVAAPQTPPTRTGRDPFPRPDSAWWRRSLAATGGLLGLIGGLGLLAWASGNPEYVQLDSTLPPLHYNTAIGLVLWAGAYLGLARGWYRPARAFAAGLAAAGVVTAVGQVGGLGLDRWAFPLPPSGPAAPPGGCSPAMSLGLLLGGAAVLLAARREVRGPHTLFGTLIGVVLVVGGPIVLATAREPRPAVLGVVGTTIAGLGLLTSAVRRGPPSFTTSHTLPLTVGVAGVVLTFGLWVGLNAEQAHRIHRQTQFEAAHVHRVAQDWLPQEVAGLSSLAERWPRTEPEQMKSDLDGYAAQHAGCLGVARVDRLAVTWVVSSQKSPLPTTLAELGVAVPIVAAARQGQPAVIRPPRSLWKGTRVVVIFAPDRGPAASTGGLLAALVVQDLFDTVINANVATGYAVTVADQGEQLFGRYASDVEYRDRWNQTLPLKFHGFDWRLTVWPTRDVLARESLSLPKLALVIGLLTTALLALAVHLAQTARRRAAELENEVRERGLTQRALMQSEEKYRTLIENLEQGIFLQDRDHRYVAVNAQFCKSVGRTEAEIVGRTDAGLFDPQRAAQLAEEARTVLAEDKTVESEEARVVDGRRVCVRRVLSPVRDAAGRTTGVLGISWDVSEQRQLEAHVHQASKMDAIGQLAGGIAHDFNNILTAIIGNLDLILSDPAVPGSVADLAEAAQTAATRAASLTQRLLGFSRQHQLDWVPTDLTSIVVEVVTLLRRTIDPLVRIRTDLAPNLWAVQADPAQLNQVLMNLCLNARDAITGAGQITIDTATVGPADLPPASGLNGRSEDFIRLRVADTGAGMTDEVKVRMYEPFFTTKEVGKGTGLGLPMVFAIVRQHKGWIDCWSEVGHGTRFDIYLPRCEAAKPAAVPTGRPAPLRVGKETILVVEDEDMIRRLAVLTLEARGFRVLEAEDGQRAVEIYSREGDRIDLVVLDLTMPVLSGHETFRLLLELNPRVKVLFASGYAVEQLSDLEKERMTGFLKKPYRPNDLVVAIEQSLSPQAGPEPGSPGPAAVDTPLELDMAG